jgi:hypothetical protein
MTRDWRNAFGFIVASGNQTHLTIYLENRGDLALLKGDLNRAIFDAKDVLIPAMTEREMKEFLAPLEALLSDGSALASLSGNVGVFRTKGFFRILSIEAKVRPGCHVASTFHVKPLLSWLQVDRDYVVIGLGKDAAHLYVCGSSSFKAVDVIGYSVGGASIDNSEEIDFNWIWSWIRAVLPLQGKPVIVVGQGELSDAFLRAEERRGVEVFLLEQVFREKEAESLKKSLQDFAREHARLRVQKILDSLRVTKPGRRVETRIQKIAQAAVRQQVEILVVAENRELFGRIDSRSGELCLHPFDMDHEDDDVLDDLAQKVLLAGGEVVVVERDQIPEQRSILAVLRKSAELELQVAQ